MSYRLREVVVIQTGFIRTAPVDRCAAGQKSRGGCCRPCLSEAVSPPVFRDIGKSLTTNFRVASAVGKRPLKHQPIVGSRSRKQ